MSAAPVADKITMTRIMNPVKETNPPKAIFNRLLVDRADKAFDRFKILFKWKITFAIASKTLRHKPSNAEIS